jgi:cytoskeleton protein RodZ
VSEESRLPEEAPASPWEGLRSAREARGLSVQEVSAHLKLAPRQIDAIERGDLSALPGAAFARGFVRNYARFLGVDAAPMLAQMESPAVLPPAEIASRMTTPSLGRMPSPGDGRYSSLPAALVVLLIVMVLGAGWYFRWFEGRQDALLFSAESSAMVVEEAPLLPEASLPVAPAASDVPAAQPLALASPVLAPEMASAPVATVSLPSVASAPVAAGARLVFEFSGESWVEVRDVSGRLIFSRLNQAGSTQEVQGTPPLELVVGNAPLVRLSWRGKAVDLVQATRGEVARIKLQ